MLSLVGISGAAFVMMSCKAPPPVPLRPAMGKGLLRADTTLVRSLGRSRWPPHSAREASMLAHDGSTSAPTATATALDLAIVLAFAPMGDAKAAAGDCYGVRYNGLCFGVGSIEVSKEHISSSAPTRRVQVAGQYLAAEEDVKELQARVATIEKEVHVPLAFPAPIFAVFLLCNLAGGALTGGIFAAVGFCSVDAWYFAVALHALLHMDEGFQRMIGFWCFSLGGGISAHLFAGGLG